MALTPGLVAMCCQAVSKPKDVEDLNPFATARQHLLGSTSLPQPPPHSLHHAAQTAAPISATIPTNNNNQGSSLRCQGKTNTDAITNEVQLPSFALPSSTIPFNSSFNLNGAAGVATLPSGATPQLALLSSLQMPAQTSLLSADSAWLQTLFSSSSLDLAPHLSGLPSLPSPLFPQQPSVQLTDLLRAGPQGSGMSYLRGILPPQGTFPGMVLGGSLMRQLQQQEERLVAVAAAGMNVDAASGVLPSVLHGRHHLYHQQGGGSGGGGVISPDASLPHGDLLGTGRVVTTGLHELLLHPNPPASLRNIPLTTTGVGIPLRETSTPLAVNTVTGGGSGGNSLPVSPSGGINCSAFARFDPSSVSPTKPCPRRLASSTAAAAAAAGDDDGASGKGGAQPAATKKPLHHTQDTSSKAKNRQKKQPAPSETLAEDRGIDGAVGTAKVAGGKRAAGSTAIAPGSEDGGPGAGGAAAAEKDVGPSPGKKLKKGSKDKRQGREADEGSVTPPPQPQLKVCARCSCTEAPIWRRVHGYEVCNACGLYVKRVGPEALFDGGKNVTTRGRPRKFPVKQDEADGDEGKG